MGNTWGVHVHPEVNPHPEKGVTFDPLLGFEKGRKVREMPLSKEAMMSAKIPLEHRDYCAHKLLDYMTCTEKVWPFQLYKCDHEKHVLLNCQYEDHVLNMKEYERERRLLVRQHKMNQQEVAH